MISLRTYQADCIRDIRAALKTHRRVLLQSPTGSGKTVMFAFITASVHKRNKRCLLLVHRDELVRQVTDALREFSVPHGVIAAGSFSRANIIVGSVWTVARRLGHMLPPDLIVIDEAHHSVSGSTWGKTLDAFPNSKNLGVSATPCRLDGRGLDEMFDDLICGPSVGSLIDAGYLSNYELYAPSHVNTSRLHIRAGDYAKNELAAMMEGSKLTGDAVEHYRKLAHGKPGVAFCVSVRHAEQVAEAFRNAGYRSVSVDGKMEVHHRRKIMDGLRNGELDVLTSCELISEGVDVPRLECGILLRPTQSAALYLQQVGRCLRPYPGKSHAIILDHSGNAGAHGMPDDERVWSLKGLDNAHEPSEKKVGLRTCKKCFAVFRPAPSCPRCGHVVEIQPRVVEHVSGELEKVNGSRQVQDMRVEIRKARTLEALQELAKARNYRPGWAFAVQAARQAKAKGAKV